MARKIGRIDGWDDQGGKQQMVEERNGREEEERILSFILGLYIRHTSITMYTAAEPENIP